MSSGGDHGSAGPDRNAGQQPSRPPVRRRRGAASRAAGGLARTIVTIILIVAFVALGVFVGGFAQFANTVVAARSPVSPPGTDAVVVLTGGCERIDEALSLLANGAGSRLLISGVNPKTSAAALRDVYPGHAASIECCVDLERVSSDTISNAIETRKWMAERGYASLTLVTSNYHMPRSLMEFSRQMRGLDVVAWPVRLDGLREEDWWREPDMLRLMLSEYIKYVGAWSRDYVSPDVYDSVRASLFGTAR